VSIQNLTSEEDSKVHRSVNGIKLASGPHETFQILDISQKGEKNREMSVEKWMTCLVSSPEQRTYFRPTEKKLHPITVAWEIKDW
jgi:hypothetical protein